MEYTCFQEMAIPFLLDERTNAMNVNSVSSSCSTHRLESFHTQPQQLNCRYNLYNPQLCNFPAVSWSTTEPTLLPTDQQQQQQPPEFLFNMCCGNLNVSCATSCMDENMEIDDGGCGLSSFPTVQQLLYSRSNDDLHHHAGVNNSIADISRAEQMNLHADMSTVSSRSTRRASSIDPFSLCVGGGGGSGVNAPSSESHWMQEVRPLSADQYYSGVDASMMPNLISADALTDSPEQQSYLYYTSSTSVNNLHDADSYSSERHRLETSEFEINRMNSSSCNDSGRSNLPKLQGCAGGDSVAGLILSSSRTVPVEFSDESSSSIAAVVDDVELATTPTLDHVQHHHRRGTCDRSGTTSVGRGAVAAHSGRVSWMSPGIDRVQDNNHATITTPDPQLQFSNGPLSTRRSELGPFTSDVLPTRSTLPFSFSTSQNCSSNISPRCSSVYSVPHVINPSFSSRPQQQHGLVSASSCVPAAGGVGFEEFNMSGSFGSRIFDINSSDQTLQLLASKKPNVPSIEPQSVAARHRRKKISERVKSLEKLIPGSNKIDTGSMLDEAIEYVKFLQLQVQLLESMGDPETLNMHGSVAAAAEGGGGSFTAAAKTATKTTTMSCSAFHPHDTCKENITAPIGSGFVSSHDQLSTRPSASRQQVTLITPPSIPKSTSTSTSSPPLILSEVLQEQLFKHKFCLVSLRQYCPQGRGSSVGSRSTDCSETTKDRAT